MDNKRLMIKIINGKNTKSLSEESFSDLVVKFENVCVDIGTGNGTYVYKQAIKNTNVLFIGIDPVKENMIKVSSKIVKRYKNSLCNILLMISSVENIPSALNGIADRITIYFPWGILLEGIVKPIEYLMKKIVCVAKDKASFDFITTYSENCDGNEIIKRRLPEIDSSYFDEKYTKKLNEIGLILKSVNVLSNNELKNFDSQWAKKLAFGKSRQFFRLEGVFNI